MQEWTIEQWVKEIRGVGETLHLAYAGLAMSAEYLNDTALEQECRSLPEKVERSGLQLPQAFEELFPGTIKDRPPPDVLRRLAASVRAIVDGEPLDRLLYTCRTGESGFKRPAVGAANNCISAVAVYWGIREHPEDFSNLPRLFEHFQATHVSIEKERMERGGEVPYSSSSEPAAR